MFSYAQPCICTYTITYLYTDTFICATMQATYIILTHACALRYDTYSKYIDIYSQGQKSSTTFLFSVVFSTTQHLFNSIISPNSRDQVLHLYVYMFKTKNP